MNESVTRVAVYTRGDAPVAARERYRTVERRLDRLDVQVERRSWPRRVSLDAAADPPAAEAYRRFRAWADDRDAGLEPAFLREVRENQITDDRTDVLVTPTICLAVYEGEDLVDVYPHRAEGAVYTVEDGLDALEATVLSGPDVDAEGESRSIAD